jgi:hypothetical protein
MFKKKTETGDWIPAYAGMTNEKDCHAIRATARNDSGGLFGEQK